MPMASRCPLEERAGNSAQKRSMVLVDESRADVRPPGWSRGKRQTGAKASQAILTSPNREGEHHDRDKKSSQPASAYRNMDQA